MSVIDDDSAALRGISSMAMRKVLSAIGQAWEARTRHVLNIESVGGVVAARRVADGEAFDFAVLAAESLDALARGGHVIASTCTPLARSSTAVAVAAGAKRPDISTASTLRDALLGARSIGYSTGPSGDRLMRLLDRWGIADTV